MKKLHLLSIYITLFITTAALLDPNQLFAQSRRTPPQEPQKVVLETKGVGKATIRLPEDIRAGDTISGTVIAEPEGKTDAEREKNAAELNGYVVEIGGAQQTAWQRDGIYLKATITFTAAVAIPAFMKNARKAKTAEAMVPVNKIATPATNPGNFEIPRFAQPGRPLEIPGPFDGSFENTSVMIGGKTMDLIAESPHQVYVDIPADSPSGNTNITISDGSKQQEGEIRTVGVNLTAPKTNLKKGEKTDVTVRVVGLEGITKDVPLDLQTTGTVNMSGGNSQTMIIKPGEVGSDGTYTTTRTITGVTAGSFSVRATVITNPPAGDNKDKCKCECELAKTPIVTAGTRAGEQAFEANVAKASCNGNKCSVSSTAYSWTVATPAGSQAQYTIRQGTDKQKKLVLDVTASGKVTVTVTVTVTCSDGSTCSATGSATMDVKK